MAPQSLNRLSSSSSQHSTQPPRRSLSLTNPNVFSDDFALEPLDCSQDSSPSPSAGNGDVETPSDTSPRLAQGHRHSSLIQDLTPKEGSVPDHEPFDGLRLEGSSARNSTSRSNTGSLSEVSKGSIKNISAFGIPQTQSPYHGPTGPSHPYGMYPQGVGISRNPSSATTSSARAPEGTYAGSSGPTQPYGMYTQNTVAEEEVSPIEEVFQPLPGFPGRAQNYQGRFVPDPEGAADIIGPDGHTEQLPAYTRYANDIPPKVINPAPGIPFTDPSNPLGESRDTLNTFTSDDADPRTPGVEDSSTQLGTAPAPEANAFTAHVPPSSSADTTSSSAGGHFKERVREKGKQKVCFGKLPMWVCMAFLLICACLIGAIIGGVLGRAKAASEATSLRHTKAYVR